jgi:hypothetical protein
MHGPKKRKLQNFKTLKLMSNNSVYFGFSDSKVCNVFQTPSSKPSPPLLEPKLHILRRRKRNQRPPHSATVSSFPPHSQVHFPLTRRNISPSLAGTFPPNSTLHSLNNIAKNATNSTCENLFPKHALDPSPNAKKLPLA